MAETIDKELSEGLNPFPIQNKITSEWSELTLEQSLDKAIDLKKKLRERSIEAYNYTLRVFHKWAKYHNILDMRPADFTDQYALSFIDDLVSNASIGPRTCNNHLGFITTLFNVLKERKVIVSNPFFGIERLPVDIGKNIAFNERQKDGLKDYFLTHDPLLYTFVETLFYTFMRPVELTRLRVRDINPLEENIRVPGTQSKGRVSDFVDIPNI